MCCPLLLTCPHLKCIFECGRCGGGRRIHRLHEHITGTTKGIQPINVHILEKHSHIPLCTRVRTHTHTHARTQGGHTQTYSGQEPLPHCCPSHTYLTFKISSPSISASTPLHLSLPSLISFPSLLLQPEPIGYKDKIHICAAWPAPGWAQHASTVPRL